MKRTKEQEEKEVVEEQREMEEEERSEDERQSRWRKVLVKEEGKEKRKVAKEVQEGGGRK